MSSQLSQQQILQNVHDPVKERLRVDSEVTATIGTVEVDIDYQDDSIAIGDPDNGNILSINSDGSLNVALSTTSVLTEVYYNEVTSVASNVLTTLLTYTASVNDTQLKRIDYSGENIATYEVQLNAVTIDKQRTYFGNSLNGNFVFDNLILNSGDTVQVKVVHDRPDVGDFNAKILVGV